MPRPIQLTRESLMPMLSRQGAVSATELARQLGVHRVSVVRALGQFGEEVVTVGAARGTRYWLRRAIRQMGVRWPVYALDERGAARRWATLESLHPRRWRVQWEGPPPAWAGHFFDRHGLSDGFPFFLTDMRPEGFIGRTIARRLPRALGLPDNPQAWSDEDTVVYLLVHGDDVPGSLVLGDEGVRLALRRGAYSESAPAIDTNRRAAGYEVLARAASESLPGSSAGGEQPKFLTLLRDEAGDFLTVLVKFSPPLDQPVGRRWADLLSGECHALTVLAEHGLAHPGARVLDAAGRRFLELPRFDRIGMGGRRGVVSLAALEPGTLGDHPDSAWLTGVASLFSRGLISSQTVDTIRRLHAFGELIGNSDRHAGNLSFWLDQALPFRLAPAYDMLPMLWAPSPQGEIIPRAFAPSPPVPGHENHWRAANHWAAVFWQRVADDPLVSPEFQHIARSATTTLTQLGARLG